MAGQYSSFRTDIDGLLGELGELLGELVEAPRGEATEENALIDNHLQQFFKAYYELKSRHDDTALSCAVLALTKSGKSTLLNALLGAECLPVNNVPETARICKIVHTPCGPEERPWMQEGDMEHVGEAAIRQRLQEVNSEVRAREHQPHDEKILHIYAPLSALEGLPNSSDSHTKIYLLDTPGPNEAGEEALRFQVERLLDSVDAVIYLLDYTKLKTAEEAAILQRLKGANPLLVRRLSRRLFFAVNKVDQVAQSEGLDEDETREYVAHLITRQLACDEFQLMPEQVLLVSARDALLSRLVLTGRASESAQALFLRNAFGRRGATRPRPVEEVVEAAAEMLHGSGLLELEERVLRFLYAQGGGVKLLATADDIARLLKEVENVALATEGALRGGVEGLAAKADGLRGDLQGVLQRLDEVLQQTATLHSQITDEIRTHLEALRTRLFRQIMESLDASPGSSASGPSTSTAPPAHASPAAAAAAAAALSRAAAAAPGQAHAEPAATGSGRWAQVRCRFASLFGSSGAAAASGTAAGSTGLRTKNKEELMAGLRQLHEDVIHQINSEVRDFWGGLEAVCNARNASVVAEVNAHLAELVGRVEAAVEARLDVRLQAVALRLPQPSSQQFHSDLQDLIVRGVEERQERHVRVGQKEFLEKRQLRVKGHGLCSFGSYWVTAPVTKTFVETYTSTVYQLQPSEVLRHFIELVDSAVDSSEQVLAAYVHRYLHSQLDDARRQIQEYGERYISVVTTALDASYEDSEAREAALAHVRARLEGARCLAARVGALQQALVDFVPAAISCSGYEEVQYMDYLSGSEYDSGAQRSAANSQHEAAAPVPPADPPAFDHDPPHAATPAPPTTVLDPTTSVLMAPLDSTQHPHADPDPTLPHAPTPASTALRSPFESAQPAPSATPDPLPTPPPIPSTPSSPLAAVPSKATTAASPPTADSQHPPATTSTSTPADSSAAAATVSNATEPSDSAADPLNDPPAEATPPASRQSSEVTIVVVDSPTGPPSRNSSLVSVPSFPDIPAATPADRPAEPASPQSSLGSSLYSARSTSPDPFRLATSDHAAAAPATPLATPPTTSPDPTLSLSPDTATATTFKPTTTTTATATTTAADPFPSHPMSDPEEPSIRSPSPDIPEIDDLPSPSPPCTPTAPVPDEAVADEAPTTGTTPPRATSPTVRRPIRYLDDVHHPPPLTLFPNAPAFNPNVPSGLPQAPLPPNTLQMSPIYPPLPAATPFPPPAANDSHLLPHTPPLSPTTVKNVTSAIHNYDEMMSMPPPPAPPAPPTLNAPPFNPPTMPPAAAPATPPAATPSPTAPMDIPISSTARDSVTTTSSSRPASPTSPGLRFVHPPMGTTPATPTLAPAATLGPASGPSSSTAGSGAPAGHYEARAPAGPVEDVDVSEYATICVKKDEIPDPPFDYQRGFAEVMSSGGLASSPSDELEGTPRAPGSDGSDDWTLVEGSGF